MKESTELSTLPFSWDCVKVSYGNIEEMLDAIRNFKYVYGGEQWSTKEVTMYLFDIAGNFNKTAWSKGRQMPEKTYGLEIIVNKPVKIWDATSKDIKSVTPVYCRHYNGTYSYCSCGNIKHTNMIPLRVD